MHKDRIFQNTGPGRLILCFLAAAFLGIAAFAGLRAPGAEAASSRNAAAQESYLYLAELAAGEGDTDTALLYLKKLYASGGETPEGTLLNARIMAMRGDFEGAQVLYEKLNAQGSSEKLSEADENLKKACDVGEAMSYQTAAAVLSEVSLLKENGKKPEDYGYTPEMLSVYEKIASGEVDYAAIMQEAAAADASKMEKANKGLADLKRAFALAEEAEEQYALYIRDLTHDPEETAAIAEEFLSLYKASPDLFSVAAIDEAFVKALVMVNDKDTLVEYAYSTNSQYALMCVAQLVSDRHLKEEDLPEQELSISKEELKQVIEQCNKAVENTKEKEGLDGASLKNLEDKAEAVKNLDGQPGVTELDSRLDPESAPIGERSKLFLGNAAFHYDQGNTEKGDEELKKAMETAPFSDDPAFGAYIGEVTGVMYSEDGGGMTDVGDLLKKAYQKGIANKNPDDPTNEEEEEDEEEEEIEGAEEEEEEEEQEEEKEEEEEEKEEEKEEDKSPLEEKLTNQGTSYVSKTRAMMNVGAVDATEFPTVKFMLQTARALEKGKEAESLMLLDCGLPISKFSVTPIEYKGANIYMVLDKSGSMEGSEESLKSAVRSFASHIGEKEKVGVIGFSDHVEFQSGLVSDGASLEDDLAKVKADGGTNIASGAYAAVGSLSGKTDYLNAIVLMTDGEDDSFGPSELENLREKCNANNIILYTIGMGSNTNPQYLSSVAAAGNGRFMYSYSINSLSGLYDFIHNMMENNYLVSFEALDRTTSERELTVTDLGTGQSASKAYTVPEELLTEDVEDEEFSLTGFRETQICRREFDAEAKIGGTKFTEEMKCVVSLSGDQYAGILHGLYDTEETFSVLIPASIPYGTYTAVTTVGTKSVTQTIHIIPEDEHEFVYGAYKFTADKVVREPENKKVTLSGNVTLGGFAKFYGDVVFDGDPEEDTHLRMLTTGGYDVKFKKPIPGLFGVFFPNDIHFSSLGDYTIYKDEEHKYDLDNYHVEEKSSLDTNILCFVFKAPSLALYPHRVYLNVGELNFNLPLQEQIFKHLPYYLTTFQTECKVIVNEDGIFTTGMVQLDQEGGVSTLSGHRMMFLGKVPMFFSGAGFRWDTYKHEYAMTASLSFQLHGLNDNKCTLDWGVKKGDFDSLMLHYKHESSIPLIPGKLSWNNWGLGISDISKAPAMASFDNAMDELDARDDYQEGDLNTACWAVINLLSRGTWKGAADFEVFNVSDKVPILKKLFDDDVSLVTFADTTISMNFEDLVIALDSKVNLLGVFDFGQVQAKLGSFEFSDYMLGIPAEEVAGISLQVDIGPNWSTPNFKFQAQGATAIGVNSRASYYKTIGHINYDIKCFGSHSGDVDGLAELAAAYTGVEDIKFYIIIKRNSFSMNESAGFKACLAGWSWDTGIEFL